VTSLKKLAIGTGRNSDNFILGPGSSARNFAERLTGAPIDKFEKIPGTKGSLRVLENVQLDGRTAKVVAREFAKSKGFSSTLEVQFFNSAGERVKTVKFRTDNF
jgi:hypothetical protein